MENKITIEFTGKLLQKKPVNDQLTLCKCYVMALGENQNKTFISKKAAEKALPTLFNMPVVGHIRVDEEGKAYMGGHDKELELNKDGTWKFKPLTVPYGVVPAQDDVHFEEVEEDDGTKNTYLVADVILWTGRYPELLETAYSEDIFFAQSMEILPRKMQKKDGITEIIEYQYLGLCMLGKSDNSEKNTVPCFGQARIEPYDFEASEEWIKLFKEFKEEVAKCYESQNTKKGGEGTMDTETIKNVLAEYGLTQDNLSFEVTEDMTEEQLREKLQECVAHADKGSLSADTANAETTGATTTDGIDGEPKLFSIDLTYQEKRAKLEELLLKESLWTTDECVFYWLADFNEDAVYCSWKHEGVNIKTETGNVKIPYSQVADKLVLDMEAKEPVRLVWLTKADEEKIEAEQKRTYELEEYKKARIEGDRRAEFALVLDEFKDLGDYDEYKEVVKGVMDFACADALREKLYAIRGKYVKPATKKPIAQIRIPVGFSKNNTELDEFMSKYSDSKK